MTVSATSQGTVSQDAVSQGTAVSAVSAVFAETPDGCPSPGSPIAATRTLEVPFSGDAAGSGGLNWGQQHIFGAIRNLGSSMNMCAVRELPPGAAVEDYAEELSFYLNRFQAMRTLLRFEAEHPPIQIVHASGTVPLQIVDLYDDADATVAISELVAEHEQRSFDDEREFPIRMVLIRQAGVLTHLLTVLNHFATDGAGAFAMYEDFLHRDPVTGLARGPAPIHPLDLTAQQATPAGRRQSDASLRYWEKQLAALPRRRPTAAVPETGSRYRRATLRSVPLLLGATRIAHRLDCDVSAVLLGLFATALARLTGERPTAAQMLVSNRFRPGMADIVGNVSQSGLFVVDVTPGTLDDVIESAQRAVTRTYKYAYFDLEQWKALLAAVERDRGEDLALCYYNDRPSQRSGTAPGAQPTPEAVAEAAPGSIIWTDLPFFNEHLMITIDNIPDDDTAITVLVSADTWHVPRKDMETLARTMESLAVAAAYDPATTTGVPAAATAAGE
ncbi:condensation domain protein [Catenulispora acidiphila DSM 44928]|uniref:Condensation domain protein n=1 Tax=Catenulispora acidiphila (strain DSM 44928 / JCM 14897 / NBRC 102108 / NRRL B-24433 / ID139908) TaxID=479433 RepID=C7Q6E2_CATAD|nr:condensation domain-containing protein [Catenulispora acidiphila]ACU72148.1 condensation domain protein [Catenulispora acidiphila DSM 44928]